MSTGEPARNDDRSGTAAPTAPPPAPVTRGWLIGVGIAVVVLSFVAAFLGGWLARSASSDEAAPSPAPTVTAEETDYEEALEDILPAGSAVRAGTGVPESGKGYEGDVYIDLETSDVYLFQDGDWTLVGNIRQHAAENLTGEQGPQGQQGAQGQPGAQGEQGAQGPPGEPGTQVSLGIGAPDPAECTADGDIYIDTEAVTFYECSAGRWVGFGPSGDTAAPQPEGPEPSAEPSE